MRVARPALGALIALFGLSACQTDPAESAPPASALISPVQASEDMRQPQRSRASQPASEPVEFVKVQYGIPRGSRIGTSIGQITRCYGGGLYTDKAIYFDEVREVQQDAEFVEAFHRVASSEGLDVVGDPKRLFERRDDRSRATYSVAAEIVRVDMTVCNHMHWFFERPLGRVSGSANVEVDWHIYDKLQRKVVHTERTHGKAYVEERPGNVAEIFVIAAFEDAAGNLAASQAFRRIVAKGAAAQADEPSDSPLSLSLTPNSTIPLTDRADELRRSTVVIDLVDGHGSGFFVDPRGYILTNQHVVGDRQRVIVQLFDGRDAIGQVLRRDKARDVALVKVDVGLPALSMRLSSVAVAEEVYAIGAPLDPRLSSTLTKGVVSAIRRERNGLEYIQADANIQAGSSGGPLLDSRGNVIGISVSGFREGGVMTGVNFFVPIQDALERLKLNLVDKPSS